MIWIETRTCNKILSNHRHNSMLTETSKISEVGMETNHGNILSNMHISYYKNKNSIVGEDM